MAKKNKKKKARKAGPQMNGQQQQQQGMLASLLPSGRTEQFLLGAALGAAAAYLLSDEELRGKLIKSGIKLYTNLMGSIEEIKEQAADLNAEVMAEQSAAL